MALFPVAVSAQSTETPTDATADQVGVADIVVTAQKRSERLQDVPIAITAVTQDALQKQGVRSVVDIGRLSVPGLTTSQQTGSPIIGLNIRGISSQDQQQATLEQGVALYIDGVYVPRTQGLMGDLVEVDRVEVLRGPQGTLFGRNAEGGAISIVSKGPTGELGGTIGGEIGDFGNRRGYVHLNLPEVANIAIKLDGYGERFRGYTKNADLAPGQILAEHVDYGARRNYGGRAQVLWTPSDSFSALLSADYSRLKNAPTYQPFDTATAFSPVDPNYRKETLLPLYNRYYRDKVSGQSLVLTYDLSDEVTVKSITARRKVGSTGGNNLYFFSVFPIDALGNRASGVFAQGLVDSKTFSQEFQLIGKSGEFEYTLGAFYFREDARDRRANFATIFIPRGGSPASVNPIDLRSGNDQSIESNAFAIFGQTTWTPGSFDDKLKITLGGRYTEDRKTAERTVFNNIVLANPIRPQASRTRRFDPALTIAYQATPDINVYARYAQAFRAGGVSVRSPNFRPYGSESNKQVEAGLKSDLFDRRVRFNVAAFHSWVKDQQINAIPPDDPTVQDIINAVGTTKLYGVEFETVIAPVKGLTFTGNLALQDGSQPAYNCGGCVERSITYFPRRSAGFAGDYTTPLGDFAEGFIHIDYKYQSNFHTSPIRFTGQKRPFSGANVWNGRVGLQKMELGGVKTDLSVFVDNIFDNHEIIFDTNVLFQNHRPPRRFGVQASVAF